MLEEIARGLAKHKLVPFFGAGVSAPQISLVWSDLTNELADAIVLPERQRADPLEVADLFVDSQGPDALARLLRQRLIASAFDDVKGWAHLWLLSLNAGVLYTTNQDNLYELAAKK